MEKICFGDIGFVKDEDLKKIIYGDKLDIEFEYKSDFSVTKDIRDFISVSGKNFGFPEKILSRIILVCDELNNNAIEHGSSKDGINIFRLKIEKIDGNISLNIEVEDDGKGKNSKNALEMETLRAHKLKKGYGTEYDSIRGRGLFLITLSIVDRLYFKNSKKGGLIVGIKKVFEGKKDS